MGFWGFGVFGVFGLGSVLRREGRGRRREGEVIGGGRGGEEELKRSLQVKVELVKVRESVVQQKTRKVFTQVERLDVQQV